MEDEYWRRNHRGGIMEEESLEEESLEEESWRRNHRGGIMEEESLEEESWRRNH